MVQRFLTPPGASQFAEQQIPPRFGGLRFTPCDTTRHFKSSLPKEQFPGQPRTRVSPLLAGLWGEGRYLQAEHSLHGDEQRRDVEGLKENLSSSLSILAGVQGSLRQEHRMLD